MVVSNHENYTHEIFSTPKYHDSLPDPSGLLSSSIPIAEANQEVEEAIRTVSSGKRGPYKQYSLTVRAEIGKNACHHGVTAPVAASQVS